MKTYNRIDHTHCPPRKSPCGHKGEHDCCLCREPYQKPSLNMKLIPHFRITPSPERNDKHLDHVVRSYLRSKGVATEEEDNLIWFEIEHER